MYKKLIIKRLFLLFLLIIFIYKLSESVIYAEETKNLYNSKENFGVFQKRIEKLEKDIEALRKDLLQNILEGYSRSCEAANRLVNFVGLIATIFGIIIALAGVFIGFEAIRSRRRREEAIETLEEAKLYVKGRTKEFDKAMEENMVQLEHKFSKLAKLFLDQLSQDTEEAARKVREIKEIKEKGISTEAQEKLELLEKRIRFFEEIGMPDNPKLLYSKAMVFKEKERWEEGLKLLKKAVELDPKYQSAFWQIGWIQYRLGNYEEAVTAYDKARILAPDNSAAYNNIGLALQACGKEEKALELFNKAIELNPEEALYYRNKAALLMDLTKFDGAIGTINKAIELNPKVTSYYNIGGRISNKMGKMEKAKEYYRMVLEIEKENIKRADGATLINCFELFLMLGKYKEAKDIKPKIADKVKREDMLYVFDFLCACLFFLEKNETEGFEKIFQVIQRFKKTPLEKPSSWIFEDINPFLKLYLPQKNIYTVCILVEKMLLREISPDECSEKIKKFIDKK